MVNVKKIIFLIFVAVTLCLLTVFSCYKVAEFFFFDKLFYYKSVAHGYWLYSTKPTFSTFGNRGKDMAALSAADAKVLGDTDDNTFKIAILGDSLTWGQGIKNNQRYAVLLEKKLNQIRPTKVYSLANNGDTIFDHYIKYKKSLEVFGPMDLYIFGLFNNDLVYNDYSSDESNHLIDVMGRDCSGSKIFHPGLLPENGKEPDFETPRLLSMNPDSHNYCSYKHLLPLLPRVNSIYIDLGSLHEDWEIQHNFTRIVRGDLNAIIMPYDSTHTLTVSSKEGHPNALANRMYTDILFNEITTNPKWGFISNAK